VALFRFNYILSFTQWHPLDLTKLYSRRTKNLHQPCNHQLLKETPYKYFSYRMLSERTHPVPRYWIRRLTQVDSVAETPAPLQVLSISSLHGAFVWCDKWNDFNHINTRLVALARTDIVLLPSDLLHRLVWYTVKNVSVKGPTSIFRVENVYHKDEVYPSPLLVIIHQTKTFRLATCFFTHFDVQSVINN
jgi:hypothetical protein